MIENTGERIRMNKDATLPEIPELSPMPDELPPIPFDRDPIRDSLGKVIDDTIDFMRQDDEDSGIS
jgi:hypothetical protein